MGRIYVTCQVSGYLARYEVWVGRPPPLWGYLSGRADGQFMAAAPPSLMSRVKQLSLGLNASIIQPPNPTSRT